MKLDTLMMELRDYDDFELVFSFTDGFNIFPNMRSFKIDSIAIWEEDRLMVLIGVESDEVDYEELLVRDLREHLVGYEDFEVEFRFIDMHKKPDIIRFFTIDGVDDIGHSSKEVILGGTEK